MRAKDSEQGGLPLWVACLAFSLVAKRHLVLTTAVVSLSGKYLQLGYGLSGVPQVQNGSMFVEPQVRELLLWLCHIRD